MKWKLTIKKREKRKISLYQASLIGFIFSQTIDFGGALGIKYLSLLPLLYFCIKKRNSINIPKNAFIVFTFLWVLWPIFSFGLGLNSGAKYSDAFSAVTFGIPALLFLLFLSIENVDIEYPVEVLMKCLVILCGTVCVLYFIWFIVPHSNFTITTMKWFYSHKRMGYIGLRHFSGKGFLPIVYFRATLFLVALFIYSLLLRRQFIAGVAFFVLGISYSKAGILSCFIVTIVYLLSNIKKEKSSSMILLGFLIVSSLVFYTILPTYFEDIFDTISGEQDTTQVRLGHLDSYDDLFSDPFLLVVGQGGGIDFYSEGVNRFIQSAELSHFEAIRIFGLFWTICWFTVILYIVYRLILKKNGRLRAIGYSLGVLFIAGGTNPVLLTPLFSVFTVTAYVASEDFFRRPLPL